MIANPQSLVEERYRRESLQFFDKLYYMSEGLVLVFTGLSKGTGFFVSSDGWILTAGHGVDFDFPTVGDVWVKLERDDSALIYRATSLIKPPVGVDLLLVKVEHKPKFFFKNFKRAQLFEETWVFGFRGTSGKALSSPGYITTNSYIRGFLQTTASATFGNSGSPVINRGGDVLGVCIAGVRTSGDTLFVPATVVVEYLRGNGIKVNLKD